MSFVPNSAQKAERLDLLRTNFHARHINGFLVPRTDEYQNEYIPDHAQRLAWLTGFTGSAGLAIILTDKAALFTDGRYTLQAPAQIDTTLIDPLHSADYSALDWIKKHAPAGLKLGYDPWLHTQKDVKKFERALSQCNGELIPVSRNIIDEIWSDQPTAPETDITPHPLEYSGENSLSKRQRTSQLLAQASQDIAVISDPSSIAWLLNVRAMDVPCTPLPLSLVFLHKDGAVDWLVNANRLEKSVYESIGPDIKIHNPDQLELLLASYSGKMLRYTNKLTPYALIKAIENSHLHLSEGDDPCELHRACKNITEINGSARAHIRDGAALVKFLYWLENELKTGTMPTELDAEKTLTRLRQQTRLFKDLSFEPISGFGPNGAIVHYRATEATNRTFKSNNLYLIDSGGQYLDGTTDITRTVAIGHPTDEMCRRYTEVLKGHISLARQRFPEGTTGAQLDILARSSLWQSGMDYAHGTGHGVGSYLGVHEGPQRISGSGHQKIMNGMIISNEPGYYKTGAYGIRIENLVVARPDHKCTDERMMMAFDTLTCAPIDTRPVMLHLLSTAEKDWLNSYHQWVRFMLTPLVSFKEAAWLSKATEAI